MWKTVAIPTLIFLSFQLSFAQKTSLRKLKKGIQQIEAFDQALVGLQLIKLSTGQILAEHHQADFFTPASNVKLMTVLASAQTFDSLPALYYQQDRSGVIHFESAGYPLFEHPLYPDDELKNWLQSADSLVYHFSDESHLNQLGPGWAWDDRLFYFSAMPSAFPIYGNVVRGTTTPNNLWQIHPDHFPIEESSIYQYRLFRELAENRFYVNPNRLITEDTLFVPFITSEKLTVAILGEAIGKAIGSASASLQSPIPLHTNQDQKLYRSVLQQSDNLISENLLLMVAKERLGVFSSEAIIAELSQEWKTAPDDWIWVDGSGLSRYNLVTPRNLIWTLQKLFKLWGPEKIIDYFPEAGVSGTLLKEYGSKKLPRVFAKTGTLRNHHNLSGYIYESKTGEWYAFSILVNHHSTETRGVRMGIRKLLEMLSRRI